MGFGQNGVGRGASRLCPCAPIKGAATRYEIPIQSSYINENTRQDVNAILLHPLNEVEVLLVYLSHNLPIPLRYNCLSDIDMLILPQNYLQVLFYTIQYDNRLQAPSYCLYTAL